MKLRGVVIGFVLVLLVIGTVSASVFSVVGPNAVTTTLQLRTIDTTTGTVNPSAVLGKDTKNSVLGVALAKLTNGANTDSPIIQTYPGSTILISDDFSGNNNIMQTSSDSNYPLLEVYYGYGKSSTEPWDYYFRIERIDSTYAYVIYGDFGKKEVRLGTIPRATYDTIISSGKIPGWGTI